MKGGGFFRGGGFKLQKGGGRIYFGEVANYRRDGGDVISGVSNYRREEGDLFREGGFELLYVGRREDLFQGCGLELLV